MLKIIAGLKGSGKTKQFISMVNQKVEETDGSVVCLEKGNALMHEIKYQARLIDTEEYGVDSAALLLGFVYGIIASNSDVTDLYVEHAFKICGNNVPAFEDFVRSLVKFTEDKGFNAYMTASVDPALLSDDIKAYM